MMNFGDSQQINYDMMSDESIITRIHNGENEALEYMMGKYSNLVNMKASKFFISGAEKEDIVQEGLIGLYKATKSFDPEKQNSFKSFANMCIDRQLITALKGSNRQKHLPLNSYISLNTPAYDNEDASNELFETFDCGITEDPLDTVVKKEYYNSINSGINDNLSQHEKQVLAYYKEGKSYADIAMHLNCKIKSVDTAMSRIRKKANKLKSDMDI